MVLENSGLTVIILGSGTCVPSLKRSSCSVLMEVGQSKLLFDSGPGTIRRLLEAGTTIFEISHIFYSHFHLDHSGEFVPILFSTKYPDGQKRKAPLTVTAGRGFKHFFAKLGEVYGQWMELAPGLLIIKELDNRDRDAHPFEDFSIESTPVVHNEESIAYRVSAPDGTSVVYSGDTDFSENLIDLADGADVLICECAMPDEFKANRHLTPSLAGEIASRANVGQLVLTHFYPECDRTDIKSQCRKTYGGPLILAEDLMQIKIG
jgi:ribonuclease BN (tRNA processing enzyme)